MAYGDCGNFSPVFSYICGAFALFVGLGGDSLGGSVELEAGHQHCPSVPPRRGEGQVPPFTAPDFLWLSSGPGIERTLCLLFEHWLLLGLFAPSVLQADVHSTLVFS